MGDRWCEGLRSRGALAVWHRVRGERLGGQVTLCFAQRAAVDCMCARGPQS